MPSVAQKSHSVFLSKLNRDTYTRRCFEIPATKTFLLSEYSADLASIYQEGEEAEFFRDRREFIAKIIKYLADDAGRRTIAEAGYRRVHCDGHDVNTRMAEVVRLVENIRGYGPTS